MATLVPMDDYGMFIDKNDTARVDSRFVAQYFEKQHKHVLRDIEKLLDSESGLSEEFKAANFTKATYKDAVGRNLKCYHLTHDGFTLLAMGYTGKRAMEFKELYIRHFKEMKKFINALVSARQEFPLLTENIKLLNDDPKPYHFSNECDMLNRIVIGMTAKQFRILHGLDKGASIRPYLTQEQIDLLETLQKVDIGLLVSVPEYQQRKHYLEVYAARYQKA